MERRMNPIKEQFLSFIAICLSTILAAAMLKFADLPTRISVVETRQTGLEQRLISMDNKLDAILGRIRR